QAGAQPVQAQAHRPWRPRSAAACPRLPSTAPQCARLQLRPAAGAAGDSDCKNAWARVTLPKNSFNPSTGIPWSSIKAVRISVHTTTEGAGAVFVDELKLV